MKLKKILLSLGIGLVLVGCDSRIDAVNQQMADIRNQPPQAIEPAPVLRLCHNLIMQPIS